MDYWFDVIQNESNLNLWVIEIMSDADLLRSFGSYYSKEEARAAAQGFIEGIKYATGEI